MWTLCFSHNSLQKHQVEMHLECSNDSKWVWMSPWWPWCMALLYMRSQFFGDLAGCGLSSLGVAMRCMWRQRIPKALADASEIIWGPHWDVISSPRARGLLIATHQDAPRVCQHLSASVPCWPNSTSRASAIGDSTLPMEQSFKETNPRSPSLFDNLVILFFTKQI